jgi:hypothetical protein
VTRNPLTARYLREFVPALGGYIVVLPVLPMWSVMRATVRHMLRQEMQQRIELQAVAVTCAVVGILTFSVGFLQNVKLLPSPPWLMLWVLPVMIGSYGVARALVTRRYR